LAGGAIPCRLRISNGPKLPRCSGQDLDIAIRRLDDRQNTVFLGPRPDIRHWKSTMGSSTQRLDIEEVGDVTIAKFIDKKILDENNIQIIGNQLFALVDEDARTKIILDFSNVEYLSSAALGKLITMEKKVKAAKGKLRLSCIRPEIYEVFAITKLNRLFKIYEDQERALDGF
jgi:anti-sigma B factor antagonist